MRAVLRGLGAGVLISLVSTFIASVALAGSIHFYDELLTSGAFIGLPGDMRAQPDASIDIGICRTSCWPDR